MPGALAARPPRRAAGAVCAGRRHNFFPEIRESVPSFWQRIADDGETIHQQDVAAKAASYALHLVGSPKLASRPLSTPGGATGGGGGGGGGVTVNAPPPNPGTAQSTAYNMMSSFGFNPKSQFGCLNNIWTRESGWRWNAQNA